MKKPRAYKAGLAMGKAVVEMVNLMYQDRTAKHFYNGLRDALREEIKRRKEQ